MFNLFDAIVLLVMVSALCLGFQTGIIVSLFAVLSGFAGMWSAHMFSAPLGMNFYLVFFGSAAMVLLAGYVVSRVCKAFFMGGADRLIGALLGLVLGVAITVTVLLPLSGSLPKKARETVLASYSGSRLIPRLQKAFPGVRQFRLDKVKDYMSLSGLKETADFALPLPSEKNG